MAQENEAQVRGLSIGVVVPTGALWGLTPIAFLLSGDPLRALLSGVLLAGLLVVYWKVVVGHIAGTGPGPHAGRTFALFAVVVYGSFPLLGLAWAYMPLIVGSAALLLLRFRLAAPVLAAVTAAEIPLTLTIGGLARNAALQAAAAVFVASVVAAGIVHYARFIRELRELRAVLAEMAVDEDRVRLAAELHDLLGQTLASIRLKTEVALALFDRDRDRAMDEIEATVLIASEAREEIGDVVAARRSLDLGAELSAAVALIELTGARCDLRLGLTEIDEVTGDALAWIVREAATNVVRHSTARTCVIELDDKDGRVHLLITNDGARRATRGDGSGLIGLRQRVDRLHGDLKAEETGTDGFELRVWLPAVHDQERVITVDSRSAG
ncbi:sensor histidine kinase [Herbidospora daliensis]|uniref:sensor histidine kinase n=1 Tax=Herbidospora daliensis TaxID=295585 RepID=UPI000783450D|nr:histidine kinase [Herbidospora daliensis]